jgi:hypothetical protein
LRKLQAKLARHVEQAKAAATRAARASESVKEHARQAEVVKTAKAQQELAEKKAEEYRALFDKSKAERLVLVAQMDIERKQMVDKEADMSASYAAKVAALQAHKEKMLELETHLKEKMLELEKRAHATESQRLTQRPTPAGAPAKLVAVDCMDRADLFPADVLELTPGSPRAAARPNLGTAHEPRPATLSDALVRNCRQTASTSTSKVCCLRAVATATCTRPSCAIGAARS